MTTTLRALAGRTRLGDGSTAPLIGFGTFRLVGDEGRAAIATALEVGYRHFDTATSYGNQAELGAELRASGLARADLFLTTKLPPGRAGDELATLHESLDALGTDYLDLWLVHHPVGDAAPATWDAFLSARTAGLVRAVGVSNHTGAQLDLLHRLSGVWPAVNQIRWNPFLYDAEVRVEHRRRGVAIQGYTPFRRANLDDPTLTAIAASHGVSPAQIIVRWHVQHDVSVLPRSSRREHIVSNADVAGFELTPAEMAALDGLGGTWSDD
jgi:diketogulonate reductase-like aldo/keto reductase